MIIATFADIRKLKTVNHAKLYETYTNKWIQKEIDEERTLLDAESKRISSQKIAWEMFRTGQLTVNSNRIKQLVESYLLPKLRNPEDIVYLDHDLRTSSFISSRDIFGNYQFIHRSFMEFFVAQQLAAALKNGTLKPFDQQMVYYEVVRFLNQLVGPTEQSQLLRWLDDPSTPPKVRENCVRIAGQWNQPEVLDRLISLALK